VRAVNTRAAVGPFPRAALGIGGPARGELQNLGLVDERRCMGGMPRASLVIFGCSSARAASTKSRSNLSNRVRRTAPPLCLLGEETTERLAGAIWDGGCGGIRQGRCSFCRSITDGATEASATSVRRPARPVDERASTRLGASGRGNPAQSMSRRQAKAVPAARPNSRLSASRPVPSARGREEVGPLAHTQTPW
jgi:hypothetical protein